MHKLCKLLLKMGVNGKNIWIFFKQYIFRGMHHNDVKFTHNVYYMVLHGMMEEKIMWKSKQISIFFSKLCILTHGTLILK